MNTIYLIVLYSLASLFALLGFLKISQPKKKLQKSIPWTRDFKPATIKFIGFCEFSASLGLVGPIIIGFGHYLTPYAALGLCIIMTFAGIYNSRKKEYYAVLINVLLLISCLMIIFYSK